MADKWKYYDLYYTEVLGLEIQFHSRDTPASQINKEQFPDIEAMYPQYPYYIDIGYLVEIIESHDGKQWVQYAIVEFARMINRNMKCNCLVFAEDVVTHRFTTE